MEAIMLDKKELQEISNINPNNDVFNQMIAELSKQKPQNLKLKRCLKAEQRQIFPLLKEQFCTDLINNRQYKIQDQQILDSIGFYEFMEQREKILIIWYEFLQNNAAYFIFTNESISLQSKLKFINNIPFIYKETQERVLQIKQMKLTQKLWKPKKIKIKKYDKQELFDEIFN